jgi:hypothetical protein
MRQSVPTLESAPFLTCQQQFDVTRIPSASADTSSKGQAWPHRNRSRELSLADLHLLGNIVLAIVHLSPFVPAVPRSATRRLHIDRDVFDPRGCGGGGGAACGVAARPRASITSAAIAPPSRALDGTESDSNDAKATLSVRPVLKGFSKFVCLANFAHINILRS